MKRSFPPPAQEALWALVGIFAACSLACEPNPEVQPGAPELKEFTIVQGGATPTTITPETPECASGVGTGMACLPGGDPPDALCRYSTAMNWCTCVADEMDPMAGAWNCEPFANVTAVIAVFDRLLNTAPLDPADVPGSEPIMMTMASAGAPVFGLLTDYSSTGAANGLIFNAFGPFFGNFRANGPSLLSVPDPALPSSATITVTLNAERVQAKDGVTPFTGSGLLQGGTLVFTTAPFSAAVTAPADPAMDPAVTISFTNVTNADALAGHVTATANGAPVAVTVASTDGSTFTVKPATAWPAGATVVVTVDAQTTNVLGQAIDAAASATFTAP
jgi:hypothetical protein